MQSRIIEWRHASLALTAGVLVASTLVGCARQGETAADTSPEEPPINVRVLHTSRGELVEFLEITGRLDAVQGTDLSTEETGVVESVPHDKGDAVAEGDVLVALDRDLLEAEKRRADADRTLAEYNEDRTRNLFDAKSVSGQEMLVAATQLAKAEATAAEAALRFERAAIKAPYAGVVADRYVEVGQLVTAGTPVARIVDPYTLKLTGAVTETQVRQLEVGAPVTLRLDGVAAAVTGVVHWIGFEAHPRNGKFPVEIHVANEDLSLRPGVVGRARVRTARHRDVVVIPRDAVLSDEDGQHLMVVRDGESVATPVPITLGPDQGALVVIESGLDAGARVIVRGQRDVSTGSRVAIQEETSEPDGSIPTDPVEVRERERGRLAGDTHPQGASR